MTPKSRFGTPPYTAEIWGNNSGENLVIVSTYHSAERIAQAGIGVDHVFCDEAHYLVEAQHHHVLDLFEAPYHHWTATPRYSDSSDGRGMNNTDAYGNVLQRITMERLVEEGLLAKPRLNLVRGMGTNESAIENKYSVIKTIATDQEQKIDYPPKLVFNCSGRDQLHGLAQLATEDDRFEDWTIYHISSDDPNHDDYGSWINDREVDRSTWMEEIDEEDGKALVFHYDVVTEGIDVPGISATSMFRSIGSTGTNVQIMGRALRLLPGERGIHVDQRKKTHADIYVPLIEEPFDDGQDLDSQFEVFRNLLYTLQTEGINIDPSEIRMVEQATGDSDDEEDTLEVTEGEEINNLLPDEIDNLTDVVNEEYENVQKDERQTYLNRMRVNSDSVTEAIDFFEQDRDTILIERERAELLLEHIYSQQNEGIYPSNHEITSSTYTPPTLAHNQIEKLVEAGADFSNAKVLVLNPEYLVQLYREGFRPNEVVILCDDPAMRNAVSRLSMRFGILGRTVNEIEQLDDMEFDVVVGNPPFEENERTKLWQDFVPLVNQITKENGYFSLIHPGSWKSYATPGEDTLLENVFMKNNVRYLNIGTAEQYFQVNSTFDWYVIEKSDPVDASPVVTENGEFTFDINSLPCVPERFTKESLSITRKVIKETPELNINKIQTHHTHRDYVSNKKTQDFEYPLRHTKLTSDDLKWTSKKHSVQNQKKVLLTRSGYIRPEYDEGSCGVTQSALYIPVEDKEEGNYIIALLQSNLYSYFRQVNKWSGFHHLYLLHEMPYVKGLDTNNIDEELYDHFNLSNGEIEEIEQFLS